MVAGASDGGTGGTWHAQLRGRSVVVRITGQGRFAVYERLPATFTVARHAEVSGRGRLGFSHARMRSQGRCLIMKTLSPYHKVTGLSPVQ